MNEPTYLIPIMDEESFNKRHEPKENQIGFRRVKESNLTDTERAFISMLDREKRYRDALISIRDWNEHPPTLSTDYGSNGVRDYYRNIAALAIQPKLDKGIHNE